jgi:hypothetical protein
MPNKISEQDAKFFESDSKVGLLAVEDDAGYPHITLISTLAARNAHKMMWGQFCEGMSKKSIVKRPNAGFLILSLDKELWRGKAVYTGTATGGTEFDVYNNKPLFRYNSYFGIGRVYFMDLVEISEKSKLDMGAIISGAILSRLKMGGVRGHENGALNPWSKKLISGLSTLKFLAVKGEDGFMSIIPIVQAAPAGTGRLAFTMSPYKEELLKLKPGAKAAVLALSLELVGVLVQGTYAGVQKGLGVVDIEQVYNPMPPLPSMVFPQEPVRAVTDFS